MTNNKLKLAIPLSALLLLSSCRIENDLVQQQHEEMKIEKFKIFAERKPVTSEDYVKTFGELLLRYDSINRKDYAGRKELGKVKSVRKITKAEETEVAHIEFALGSPIIIKEGGKWMVFPKVKGKQVESLVIAYVNGEETKVGYRNMDKTTDFYNEYAKYFQEGYDKLLKAREELRKKKQASRYWEDLEDWEKREIKEKLIEEIILRGYIDWESYIRDKLFIRFRNFGDYNFWDGCNFSSGMEEFCEIFGDCKNTDTGGGSDSRKDNIVDKLQGYPCGQEVLRKLPNLNNDLARLLQNTFGVSSNINITFKVRKGMAGTDGLTSSFGAMENSNNIFNAYINLNEDVLMYSTQEYILVTMYHEVIHAFLDYERHSLGNDLFSKKYPQIDKSDSGYIFIDDKHSNMGNYIVELEKALYSFNPNLSKDYVRALASGGIISLSNIPQEHISININERDTRLGNYTGTKCTQ